MEKIKPKVLLEGKLLPENISITVSESNLILTDEIEKRIKEIWEEKLVESRERGKEIFNGNSYRLNSWDYENKKLELDLAIFDYKHRLGLVTLIEQGEIDETKYVQGGCSVGATVKTSDDFYVLVKLSGKSMNNNTIEMLGGMAETETPFSGGNFLFDVLYQELEEEACVGKGDIESCWLRGFFSGTAAHYGFYFETRLNITAEEVAVKFADNSDVDVDSLLFFTRQEYLAKLEIISQNKKLIKQLVTI